MRNRGNKICRDEQRTDERGGRTARKHNAFADNVGWRRYNKRCWRPVKWLTLVASLTHPAGRTVASSSDGITRWRIVTVAHQLTVDAVVAALTRYVNTRNIVSCCWQKLQILTTYSRSRLDRFKYHICYMVGSWTIKRPDTYKAN